MLNNFGFHNNTDFINPMDIADITLIKDAAGGAMIAPPRAGALAGTAG